MVPAEKVNSMAGTTNVYTSGTEDSSEVRY